MTLKSTSKQMCVYIYIVNTYEVGRLYLTIRTEWKHFFICFQCGLLMSWLLNGHLCLVRLYLKNTHSSHQITIHVSGVFHAFLRRCFDKMYFHNNRELFLGRYCDV